MLTTILKKFVAVLLALNVVACSSATVIHSQPPGARVYLNGEPVGTTPYTMSDTKIIGSKTSVRLEYPGYEPIHGEISRNEEFQVAACIGGVFLLVPFLWVMGYKPTHSFEFRAAASGYPQPPPGQPAPVAPVAPVAPPAPPAPR